ncbi:MAG: mechanosensitive ion channel family protein [Candidatus Saganbacteria bacterium]|nr:mechanosensitive ion channel family protein [Candidatus Saganbacteria bacterium]
MQTFIDKFSALFSNDRFLMAGGVFLLWILLSWLIVTYYCFIAEKFTKKTKNEFDDVVVRESKIPIWLILIIAGFYVISHNIKFSPRMMAHADRVTGLLIIFLIILFVVRIILTSIKLAEKRNAPLKHMMPTFNRIASIIIWGVGILILMDVFGISITPILASLGIAALAIGLALQDTLGNFFSGIYILISQPVRVGDYIELENGLKGYVKTIGWRETRIRTLPNNVVVIPNTKLSQSIITNYYIPQKEMACLVQVGVSYNSDLEQVERVTIEVGKQVLEKAVGGIGAFDPFIRYHTFNDFSIDFTVILRVQEFVDKYLVTHEFIKALHKRYNQEGIVIPFPIRTVQMEKT